jgi:ankyrin repeat protein
MVGGFSTSIANFRLVVEAEKASINVKDIFGNTCLHSAAISGLGVEDFQILHTAGADLLARNDKGETFLHLLHQHHNGNTLFRILEWAMLQNIDMKITTYDGKSIIHAICERYISFPALMNMWPFFKGLGPAINLRDRAGHTPIDFLRASLIKPLAQTSPSETLHSDVESLFTKNLPEYQPSDNYTSALQHFSTTEILRSDALMLEIVRSSEHNPLIENPDGRNALHCLAYIIRYPEYPDHTLFPPTARHERVAACLRWSVPVNAYDRHGHTPLHSFLAHPRSNDNDLSLAATVELLLRCGADPCMKDRSGNTALHLACNHGKIACVEVLLRFLRSNSELYDHAIRARNDANRTPVLETTAWMPMHDPQERKLREQCLQLILGKENTEDDVKAGFGGISNGPPSGVQVVEVVPGTTQTQVVEVVPGTTQTQVVEVVPGTTQTQVVPSQPEEVVLEVEAEVARPPSPMDMF